jgi:tetratricopeptide (TPR) repeat protein
MTTARRAAALALAIVLAAGSVGCKHTINRLKANHAVKQGNVAYKAGDYLKAVEWYRKAVRLNPQFGLAYYDAGLCYMALYKPGSKHEKDQEYLKNGIENFLRFLRIEPDHQDAKNFLLSMYVQGGMFDEAIEFFMRDLRKAEKEKDLDKQADLAQKLGAIYAKKGDFDTSLQWYQKRAELQKDNPEAHYTIGVLCWDKVYHQAPSLELDRRVELIDLGLKSLKKAADLRRDYFEAVLYINLMYREKAKVAQINANVEEYEQNIAEATKHQKLALEMRSRVMAKK